MTKNYILYIKQVIGSETKLDMHFKSSFRSEFADVEPLCVQIRQDPQ